MPDSWQVEGLIGRELDGRYTIESLLGQGGMGAVLRARHKFMDQAVAVKVLRPTLARDPTAARRFVREARGTLKVESEHAVKVLDFAITEDGLLYMVLELLDGRTVGAEIYDDGPMPVRRALRVARQVCDALAAAHRVGLIHRDLKPDNIMLIRRGGDPDHVKVLDFGLAKVVEGAGNQAMSMAALTQGDLVFGTPDYMAPEQALGQTIDARTDVYALGATLFEMLTGRPPFVGSPMKVLADHVRTPPPTLRSLAPGVNDGELEALVASCLAKDPANRPESAVALAQRIGAIEARLAAQPGGRGAAAVETIDLPVAARPVAVAPAAVGSAAWVPPEPEEPRRSRVPLAIFAVALAGAAALVVFAVTRPRDRAETAAPLAAAAADAGAAPHAAALDASITASVSVDAGTTPDAAPRDAARGGSPTPSRLAMHLEAAESARRKGNRLKQIAEADQALEIDRHNQRAKWLLGDALIATDRTNGCRYLRAAGRIAAARARADAAGCPTD